MNWQQTLAIVTLLILLNHATPINAEVLDKSPSGFVIEIRAEVDQSKEQAYQQFLKVNEWWDGNHSWFGNADNFYIEPRVGGCFCEVDGEKQAQHMTVSFVEPNKQIRMLGGLGPLQMTGVYGAMSWSFNAEESGKTLIIHRYAVSGYAKDGLDKLAPIVDGVLTAQIQRLLDRLKQNTK